MIARRVASAFVLLLVVACGRGLPEYPIVAAEDGFVRIPLTSVSDGRVHFFSVMSGGKRVNFLVRTDAESHLHTHLDACYACYRYRRGFFVEGEEIVCDACRYRYSLAKHEWELLGACAPIDLPSIIRGDELLIRARSLRRAERYF